MLADALMVQDGGIVRGTDLHLVPLGLIKPLSHERWAHMEDGDQKFLGSLHDR